MTSKDKLYIISGICVVGALCFVAFFIYPTLNNVIGHSKKVLAEKAQNVLMKRELQELRMFKDQESIYSANLKKAGGMFVDAYNPVDFVQFVEQIAAQSNVSSDISLAPRQPGKPVPFVVDIAGSFAGTAAFARRMETGSYLITIKKILMTKPELAPNDPDYVLGQIRTTFSLDVVVKP